MVSVVICTYNRAESFRTTLESLARMEVPADVSWELIVVDNNSTDDTSAVVKELGQTSGINIRYVLERKQGKSYALNSGIKESRADIIAFTDDDVKVSPGWLAEIVRTFRDFDCMGVGGRCTPAWDGLPKPAWLLTEGPFRLSGGPLLDFNLGEDTHPTQVPPWGLNMAFRKSAFEKYGLFRTDLGVSGSSRLGGEDTEFGFRLLKASEKVIYSPAAIVFHPVQSDRVRKAYFLSWYFNNGRLCIRVWGWPAEAVLWFGIPRYIFRSLLENCAKWLISFDSPRRFYYKAQVWESLGKIAETRRLLRQRPPVRQKERPTEGQWT